jgi:hypothetical protein
MALARKGMREGVKYSSRSLGGHTTQYRRLCRLAGIKARPLPPQASPITGKPCRYKACKGRDHKAHGEKCPVASARGKTGGHSGEGESKQRLGSTNGKFRTVRECGCPVRQHRTDCVHARLINSPNVRFTMGSKIIREKTNIQPITWLDQALTVSAVANYLHGVRGVCSGCKTNIPATQATKVHRDDLAQNPVRVICGDCK